MNLYETIFIVNSELDEESNRAVIDKFKTMIESAGRLEALEEWGKRRLAYPIKDMTDGYYVLAKYRAPAEFPRELERVLKITDDILKFLIIRKEEKPSAMRAQESAVESVEVSEEPVVEPVVVPVAEPEEVEVSVEVTEAVEVAETEPEA